MSIQIVSLGNHYNGLYDTEKTSVVGLYLRYILRSQDINESHPVFKVYQASLRSEDRVGIVAYECLDLDKFSCDLQSSLATLAGADIVVLNFGVENRPLFLEIKNNFAPLLKQIFSHRQSVPIIVLATGHRDSPSCTCPMCTSDRAMTVSSLEGLQLAKDIGLGATYLELLSFNCIYLKNNLYYFRELLEYYIVQTMKNKSSETREKKKNKVIRVQPPKLEQPVTMPVLKDEPSRYNTDIRKLLDQCHCVDVHFCTADLNPICGAHRVVLCSVSYGFMLLFDLIPAKDIHEFNLQETVRTYLSVYQEPTVSMNNTPVRVIVKDVLFHKCLPDILHFIYSGASQWQLLEHDLKEKLKDDEEADYVSHIVQSLLNKPGTDSHSGTPLSLSESIGFFFNNTSLADVVFQVQDTKIPAHRSVLAARCDVMAAMFSGSYMETNCALIPVHGISKDTFLNFLEYIYTDTVCPASVPEAMSLMICSEMYQVSRLQHICEGCIATQLQSMTSRELASTSLNVVSLLQKAKFYNFGSLYNWLLHFVATHYQIFSQKQEFQDLSAWQLDFVEINKWPSNYYLNQLSKYRSYIHSPKHSCAVM
ncbi:rho-related BTB domain-containing protein 3 [Engystomops pustulosus]|uniref:rho-related BTB domain-containing protein 3 n=1 Tax=Engystomops pustulosus TaxID=76066 RepID=UPI003AFA4F2D